MNHPTGSPHVIVIGGGPAGTTAATLIAQRGWRVTLLERDHFPRYHIGESLIPETYHVLQRLGMLPILRESPFVKKYSVQFVNQRGGHSTPFYFQDHKPHESSQTWQVLRSEFDKMLLDNARRHGVEVHEGTRVLEVLFEGSRAVGIRGQTEAGERFELRSAVVVDASGQAAMLIDRLSLRQWDPKLRKAAVWTYFKGAYRDTGRDAGATFVIQTQGKRGWFWFIPLHDDVTSVGIVGDADELLRSPEAKDHETLYWNQVARCPGLQPRLQSATQIAPIRVAKEYSYCATQAAGEGWVVVGDAFGFLDPLYSSGVLLALKSGQLAADAVADGLAAGDTSGAQLGRWEAEYRQGMQRMRSLVCAYYDGFSFGRFIRQSPHFQGPLTDLLIGDLFKPELDEVLSAVAEAQQAAGDD